MTIRANISMDAVKRRYANGSPNGHWFDAESMRFFKTKLPASGWEAADGSVYFVSQETNPGGQTRFSVRRMAPDGSDIHTVGEFHSHVIRSTATHEAKRLASLPA